MANGATDAASAGGSSGALAKGTLVAGYTALAVKLPKGTYERYLGIVQTTAVAAATAAAWWM